MKVSVVIPAYNEEKQIESMLRSVVKARKNGIVNQVIVVDDGSEDDTLRKAKEHNSIEAIGLDQNLGKAQAMQRGVKESKHSDILFLDADLIGLKAKHIKKIVGEYEKEDCDMVVGIFHKGKWYTDISQNIFSSHLSGQRILSKRVWNKLDLNKVGEFGVEMALFKMGLSTREVRLEGLSHVLKEEKRGFLNGLQARLRMYFHVVKVFLSK